MSKPDSTKLEETLSLAGREKLSALLLPIRKADGPWTFPNPKALTISIGSRKLETT